MVGVPPLKRQPVFPPGAGAQVGVEAGWSPRSGARRLRRFARVRAAEPGFKRPIWQIINPVYMSSRGCA